MEKNACEEKNMVDTQDHGHNPKILKTSFKTNKRKLSYSEPLLLCAKHTLNPDSLFSCGLFSFSLMCMCVGLCMCMLFLCMERGEGERKR